MKMLVLVCGDRKWRDSKKMLERLSKLPENTTILEGEAPGADIMSRRLALDHLGLDVIGIPANWKRFKKAAGPIRNRRMLDMNPNLVIAFHPDLNKSVGTKDCVTEAKRRGIEVEVIS